MHKKKTLLPRFIPHRRGSESSFGLYVRHFLNSNCLCTKTSFTLSHSSQACSGTGTGLHDTYITLITYAQNLIPHRRGSGTGTRFHDTSLTLCLIGDFEKKNGRIMAGRCPLIRLSVHSSVHSSVNNLQDIFMIFYGNVYSVKTKPCPTQECLVSEICPLSNRYIYHMNVYQIMMTGHTLSSQTRYSKDRPVCYGTSRPKNGFCVHLVGTNWSRRCVQYKNCCPPFLVSELCPFNYCKTILYPP